MNPAPVIVSGTRVSPASLVLIVKVVNPFDWKVDTAPLIFRTTLVEILDPEVSKALTTMFFVIRESRVFKRHAHAIRHILR